MNSIPLPQPLRGIVPPLVTPLLDQEQLDLPGLERLIDRLLAGGVHALFALGTTGEGPSLAYALRHQFVERLCELVDCRVPVLVGITDTAFDESIELAEKAHAAGASGVVAATPYYLPLSQSELVAYVESLAERLPLPLLLYNMPACTKVEFEPETVLRLSELENVIGVKDSSGSMAYVRKVHALLADRPDFTLLVGPEELLAESVHLGAHGGVNGGANMFPALYVALYEASVAGDQERMDRLQTHVMRISRSIYAVGRDASRHVKGIKSALKWMGVCDDYVAQPFRRLEGAEREAVGRYVEELEAVLEPLSPRDSVAEPG
ncbi:MAG: dihydrodipicolinate synthase family protein [Pirellulales bacterium]